MSYYVSSDSNHGLIDISKLILIAHSSQRNGEHLYIHEFSNPYFNLGSKEEYSEPLRVHHTGVYPTNNVIYFPKRALTFARVLDLFENCAMKATLTNEKPQLALELLKQRVTGKYFSGITGALCKLLSHFFGWYSSDYKKIISRIDTVSQKILSLPHKSKNKVSKKKIVSISVSENSTSDKARKVFTDKINDKTAIGALCGYSSKRYHVQWISPRSYLNRVDPYFKRHSDEESMPWIIEQMNDLIHVRKKEPKFSPVMMDPENSYFICEGYNVLSHEGRHRALAAERLGIPEISVAIPHLRERR